VERPREPPAAAGEPVACFLGRLVPEKGVDLLLRAFAGLNGASLVVVGDGWQRSKLERLAGELGLAGRVRFTGWRFGGGAVVLVRGACVVAVPSRWPEPFGMVGLDAMAQARAVVAARVGGIPDWLLDGETGLLVEPGSPASLAQALGRVLDDPG